MELQRATAARKDADTRAALAQASLEKLDVMQQMTGGPPLEDLQLPVAALTTFAHPDALLQPSPVQVRLSGDTF